MYRYAEYIDAADFDAIAELFADAILTNEGVDGEIAGGAAIASSTERTNRVHDDGTLRTRHVTANVLVDIDEARRHGDGEIVVRRAAADAGAPAAAHRDRPLPRSTSCATRDEWRFAQRHIIVDHVGDVREHLAFDLARSPRAVSEPKHLLIVFHSRSGGTAGPCRRRRSPARPSDDIDGVEVRVKRAFDADASTMSAGRDAIMSGDAGELRLHERRDEGLLRTHLLRAASTRLRDCRTRCS